MNTLTQTKREQTYNTNARHRNADNATGGTRKGRRGDAARRARVADAPRSRAQVHRRWQGVGRPVRGVVGMTDRIESQIVSIAARYFRFVNAISLLTGGNRVARKGYFVEPTVWLIFSSLSDESRLITQFLQQNTY